MDAPARGARTAEAVRLLIEDFEACTAQVAELRARLRRHELDRKRLAAAVEPALASLPEDDARALRLRLQDSLHADRREARGKARSRHGAIVDYLSRRIDEPVKVAEITALLRRSGFRDLHAGYASEALARLAERGLVYKLSYGRYGVNGTHPEIVEAELTWIEQSAEAIRAHERRGAELARAGKPAGKPLLPPVKKPRPVKDTRTIAEVLADRDRGMAEFRERQARRERGER